MKICIPVLDGGEESTQPAGCGSIQPASPARDDIEIGLNLRNIAHLLATDPRAMAAATDAANHADEAFVMMFSGADE